MFNLNTCATSSKRFSFFPPAVAPSTPILEGLFDYNSAFKAFLNATNQKKHTADMVSFFTNTLQETGGLLNREKILQVADLGCADSSTCLGYLNQIPHAAGFSYFGFDINDTFIEEAKTLLSGSSAIKKHVLINHDVLSGGPSAHPAIQPQSMDLVFISHLAYYLKDKAYSSQFIQDILHLLNDTGLAVFLHEDSTYYFRSTYNTRYTNSSAPSLLRDSARELLKTPLQFNEMSFTSTLHFAQMSETLWQAAQNPSQYKAYAHIPSFVDNLNKLAFIVQCDLATLAREGSLGSFVNEMKAKLESNYYQFNLVTSMQVLVNPNYAYMKEINNVLREMETNSDLIALGMDTCQASICYS